MGKTIIKAAYYIVVGIFIGVALTGAVIALAELAKRLLE